MEETTAPETATQTTEPSTALGGGYEMPSNPMTFDPTSLPDGLDREPSLRNFDSVDKLAKSYVHAVKKMGVPPEQMLKIPQEGEPWDDFYTAMGRPESPMAYDFGGNDSEEMNDFREAAFELGLTQNQAHNLLEKVAENAQNEQAKHNEALEQAEMQGFKQLQKDWGGDYDKNMDYARRAFGRYASPEALELMENTGLGNHPEMLKLFSKIGEQLSEEQLLPGNASGFGQSPGDAESTLRERMNDPDFRNALINAHHPNHKEAVAEKSKLYGRMYPT